MKRIEIVYTSEDAAKFKAEQLRLLGFNPKINREDRRYYHVKFTVTDREYALINSRINVYN